MDAKLVIDYEKKQFSVGDIVVKEDKSRSTVARERYSRAP